MQLADVFSHWKPWNDLLVANFWDRPAGLGLCNQSLRTTQPFLNLTAFYTHEFVILPKTTTSGCLLYKQDLVQLKFGAVNLETLLFGFWGLPLRGSSVQRLSARRPTSPPESPKHPT